MATKPKLIDNTESIPSLFEGRDAKKSIESTHTQELVIALCGPIGSPLHDVANKIKSVLEASYNYDFCSIIKLSSYIEKYSFINNDEANFDRINSLITLGNNLRKEHGNSILAELAIQQIRQEREQKGKEEETGRYLPRRVCHIIDSIKNQSELALLKTVYRELLYVVGVFSPLANRETNLKKKGLDVSEIYSLIDRDSGEEIEEGQTIAETFPQCDFFLRMDSSTEALIQNRVERFLQLILGTKITTPTTAENAMYAAASAAGNSACLSRQVGACVTDKDGEIISTGWNDVPKPFGGLYINSESDPLGQKDFRCWNKEGGKCFNDEQKTEMATKIVDSLEDFLNPNQKENAIKAVMKDKGLRGLVEFSRSIHAEMHALLNCLNLGGSRVRGGKLYVTTYPCHACARHIIASGIKEVYYIEPYKKSLATKLHDDAISEIDSDVEKVRILPYDGVAPAKYLALFRMSANSRKSDGRIITITPKEAVPRIDKSLEALPTLETMVIATLKKKELRPYTGTNLK
ncbi:MAG: anti-phage dCTP deaminase [Cytophagales bacterium]|nr:anti-phage dCTP deaminase [Cytophagales bacterium]